MRRAILVLLLLAGAAGWAMLQQYHQQNRLHQQLAQLTETLTTENDLVSRNTEGIIKSIEAAAAKNRNQPAGLALLRRANALQACAKRLINTLRTNGDQLHRATTNKESLPLQHPSAAVGAGWDANAPRQQALARQLAAYADMLRRYHVAEAKATLLAAPAFAKATPIVEALADLTQLESNILARQTHALQRLSTSVGARRWLAHPLVSATAASDVVAPGSTYHAKLGLVSYYSANDIKMQMACNGRPVPIGPTGTGLVRFRAPTRSGLATWTGTIRLNQNGRDTTFRVTVPYHIARR